MARNPRLEIDCSKLEHNARQIVASCSQADIEVVGVTKVVCGHPAIARSLVAAGVKGLADARLENIYRLRRANLGVPLLLLRSPMPSEVPEVARWVDISFQTEISTIELLSREAIHVGRLHQIILMIDVGDIREGILPINIFRRAEEVMRFPGVRILGLGTNLGCYGGVMPTSRNLGILLDCVKEVEKIAENKLEVVSGGGSNVLSLLFKEGLPEGINQLRIGEAIFLGRHCPEGDPFPGAYIDAFKLMAEVIEVKEKPSVPYGETNKNAFGEEPQFEQRGNRLRAILALGRQDVIPEGLVPLQAGILVLGASSDHLILDVEECEEQIRVGQEIAFLTDYPALLTSMTSPYVKKCKVE